MIKLVRDHIPEIIEKAGKKPKYTIANDKEQYLHFLKKKLQEEVHEFLTDESMEEIVDIYEVLEAICRCKEFAPHKIHAMKKEKRKTHGTFSKQILLEMEPV